MRCLCYAVVGWSLLGMVAAAEERPNASAPAPADLPGEAGQLVDGLPVLIDPGAIPTPKEGTEGLYVLPPAPPLSVELATKRLAQAKQKQERWQKLAKQGVLSTMEVESCELAIAVAEVELCRARVAEAKNATGPDTAVALTALRSCQQEHATAEQALSKLRLEHAERNLGRYKRLFAARLVTKVQLQRAEELVERLKVGVPVPPAPAPVAEAPSTPAPKEGEAQTPNAIDPSKPIAK